MYEGRAGGIDKNVIGAHAQGFNTGRSASALIGNFTTATPPPAMQNALVNLLAWRLDVAHIDPLSTLIEKSRGNFKYKAGTPVTLRAISGHRDTGPTECPGNAAYALLPGDRRARLRDGAAQALLAACEWRTRWRRALRGPALVGAAVDRDGEQCERRSGCARQGSSAAVGWTWNATTARDRAVPLGDRRGPVGAACVWDARSRVGEGNGASCGCDTEPEHEPESGACRGRPGSVGTGRVTGVITPNPDGTGGYSTVDFTLSVAALVTVKAIGSSPALPTTTLLSAQLVAGDNSFEWNLGRSAERRVHDCRDREANR